MKPWLLGLIGAVITMAAGISFPFVQSFHLGATPHVILAIVGMAICVWAVTKRRGWVTIPALCISSLVGLGFIFSVTILLKLPESAAIAKTMDTLPDFTLPNQDGSLVRPASYRGKGPVLLVFYRGHW